MGAFERALAHEARRDPEHVASFLTALKESDTDTDGPGAYLIGHILSGVTDLDFGGDLTLWGNWFRAKARSERDR